MSGLAKAGVAIALGLLLGRAAGFLREAMVASAFGVSGEADLAVLLLTIPDLLVNVLVGGAFSAALIPEFRRVGAQSARLFVQASLLVAVVFTALTALLCLFARPMVFAFAPGLPDGQLARAGALVSLSLWLVPLTTLAGVSLAYLHAHNRFGVASLGTFFYNMVIVAGLALVALGTGGLTFLCAFVVLGGILRWGSQLLAVPQLWPRGPGPWMIDRGLMLRYLQASTAGGLLLLLPVAARAMASFSGEGAIASFNYAIKLTEFALGVTITVLTVAVFPRLAGSFSQANEKEFSQLLGDSLWWIVVLGLCTTLPLAWFSAHFVDLVYGWGRMTNAVLADVAALMLVGVLSLPFQGVSSLLAAAFNARRDTRGPLLTNICGLLLFFPLGYWLYGRHGLTGIMAALVAAHLFVAALKVALLRWRHGIAMGSVLLAPPTLLAALMVLVICSLIGWPAAARVESGLLGVLIAGLSAAVALAACLAAFPRYRGLLFARFG